VASVVRSLLSTASRVKTKDEKLTNLLAQIGLNFLVVALTHALRLYEVKRPSSAELARKRKRTNARYQDHSQRTRESGSCMSPSLQVHDQDKHAIHGRS